jgi:hypothetical protein
VTYAPDVGNGRVKKMKFMAIQIGTGGKILDFITLILQVIFLLGFTLMLIDHSDGWILIGGLAIVLLADVIRKFNTYYLFYDSGFFLVENLFQSRRKIKAHLYERISQSKRSIPFSNSVIVHFKNGESFKISGGTLTLNELDEQIRNLYSII